ncbi:hypothetical protein TCCBUS3UF1_12690 [Thermus sp. CCB_US3_UF1]|uniref:hypothetical protein n=1 Tax=Thermus sp. CCB_US3_UF1 TaxID=1111069 RepID=UPI000238A3F8|nr:hypothetical protein [Thermus sp. CCB_US3_UF1]AEV16312.1 hypothetical protein TCCBUS3UF1_12690 [Thermus sp. CCB_US3_UF1]
MREMLQKRFPDLVVLFVVLGCFATLAELLLMGHTEGIQLLAPVAASLGAMAAGLGLLLPLSEPLAVGVLLLVSLAGLVGTAEHWAESLASRPAMVQLVDQEGEAYPALPQGEGATQEGGKGSGQEGGEATPPPLAPLSLSGLGFLGALALLACRPS